MSMTATAGGETLRLRAPHLPYAPTDVERDSYFKRYLGPLTVLSTVGMLGITASAARFAISRPALAPYIAVVTFAALYFLISLRVNALSRDASLEEHRIRVALWTSLRCPSVDVMLPTCGEDHDVLHNTWTHVAALTWSGDLDVYVLDDADDPVARAMAEEFGFTYLVRPNRGWFKKAGNLRHGYENSSGDLIVVFDADFCPRTDFLDELVPYFDKPDVGIVQSPQHFRVLDSQGWLERGAGAVQEFFYRAVQTSRERRNGAICVGTNAIYRRAALESNGGTTLIEHSEDVHTGFDLRRNGWVLRYVSRPVDFAPMLVLGAFRFAVVFRLAMPTRGPARETKAVEPVRTPMLVNEGHRLAEVAA